MRNVAYKIITTHTHTHILLIYNIKNITTSITGEGVMLVVNEAEATKQWLKILHETEGLLIDNQWYRIK